MRSVPLDPAHVRRVGLAGIGPRRPTRTAPGDRSGSGLMSGPARSAAARRRNLRVQFDAEVAREWHRYAGAPRRRLYRVLRERFLAAHPGPTGGWRLELGPGPGRFTPAIVRGGTPLVSVDLSREALCAARRRHGSVGVAWVQGAGEWLPLASRSIARAVVLGNIVGFAARDGPRLLAELGRVVRRGGRLMVDFASPAAATEEFLRVAAERRILPRLLRRPRHYFLDAVLTSGDQPYAPARWARWEFRFYTVERARRTLHAAGFRVDDTMVVAPLATYDDRLLRIAHRSPRTWETLLRLQEEVGRRPGVAETGHGFVMSARRA